MIRSTTRPTCLLYLLAALSVAVTVGQTRPASASSSNAIRNRVQCPKRTVCDHALGLALTLPPDLVEIGPGQRPPHEIELVTVPSHGRGSNFRLDIASWGTTTGVDDTRAAAAGMQRLLRAERQRARLLPVNYGGAEGLLASGLHSSPTEATAIILAHEEAVYKILAPGSALGPDQRQVLTTLRFIPRVGPFPPETPSAQTGSRTHRDIPGGRFGRESLTLTPGNGLHRGAHTYSLWFHAHAQRPWLLSYSVPCGGRQGQVTVDVVNQMGQVVDRVLHREGRAEGVTQTEEIGEVVRLAVQSRCSEWTVRVSNIAP